MANGTNYDPSAQYAALQQRVSGIENSIVGISSEIRTLTNSINERSRTPWAIILSGASTSLGGIALVGGLIAWGLSAQQGAIVTSLNEFKTTYESNRLVSRNDYLDKFQQARDGITKIEARQVPREELDRVWQSYEGRFTDQQRQLDELKNQFGSVYGLRDVISDLKENQEEIRRQISSGRPYQP